MNQVIPILCGVALCLPRLALADSNFDVNATSPSGALLFEARSLDRAAGKTDDQRRFEYSMTDNATGKVLWKRSQPDPGVESPDEDVPEALYPGDDGRAIVRTKSEQIFVLDASGKKSLQFVITELFSQRERTEFTVTNATPILWAGNSRWSYLTLQTNAGKTELFVIRTYWGRRIVIDLAASALLDADKVSPEVQKAALEADE